MSVPLRTSVCNVLVIGSGGAGLRAAIAAHQAGAEVLVLGKRLRKDAHTVLAAGGINGALGTVDPQDSWQQHFADTLREGYWLSDPRTVAILAEEAPAALHELDAWGMPFARTPDGRIDQRFFGAHTWRRTAYAGDYTGRALIQTLAGKAEALGIPILEHQVVSHLLESDGAVFGALGFHLHSGERTAFLADAVVLAAGGHTRLWRRSSSRRDENTGDGMALALDAGCRLMDMELVQFHPTGMLWPDDWAGTLVTEAVRGEGGILRNALGERYMERYDPVRLELSTRDRVALANYTEIREGRGGPHGGVFLDVSHLPKEQILEKLPRMYRQFLDAEMLDIAREPMEVAPTAHYSMGGVVVDPWSHGTGVLGLFAAGEVTAGLHGANRLGGNSLAETVVFGRRAGEAAAAWSRSLGSQLRVQSVITAAMEDLDGLTRPGTEFARPLQRALRETMWAHCGVVRTDASLREGLEKLERIEAAVPHLDVRPTSEGYQDLATALDLRASLTVAKATLLGALARCETRGAHNRADFPATDEAQHGNWVVSQDEDGTLRLRLHPVPAIPAGLEDWAHATDDLALAGRLLE